MHDNLPNQGTEEHQVILPLGEHIWYFHFETLEAKVSERDVARILEQIFDLLLNYQGDYEQNGPFERELRKLPNFDLIAPLYERNEPQADILREATFNLGIKVKQQMLHYGVISPYNGTLSYSMDAMVGDDVLISHFPF